MVSSEVRPHHAQNADPAEKCGRRPSGMRMTRQRVNIVSTGGRAIAFLSGHEQNQKDGVRMKATELLRNFGQSLWLDNITRDLLNDGTLKRYIEELSITGLTSNPTIFDHAVKSS